MRAEKGINTASDQPPGTTPSWARGHLDYACSEGDAGHPGAHAKQAAAQDLDLLIYRLTTGERLALAVSIPWLLTSRCHHLKEGTRTMADITFDHQAAHAPLATMDHAGYWHYVATRLMAHMGAYSPHEMNELHRLWHQRSAVRIRTAMQRDNIWAMPGSPGYQGHVSSHQRPRSQDIPELPRQAARHNSQGRPQGPPNGVGSPSGTYGSPVRPFAPRREQGSPHTPGVQGNKPERHQEMRNPGRSRRRSRTPPLQHGELSSTRAWTEAIKKGL